MRASAGVLMLMAAFTGCEQVSPPQHRSVKIKLDPVHKSIGAGGPSESKDDPWPYGMAALGRKVPSDWIGMGLTKEGGGAIVVEIRGTEVGDGSVRVHVTYAEAFNPDLASLAFDHLGKVDQVIGGDGKPYLEWTHNGENLVLRAPKEPARITFLAWPHVH